MNFAIILSYNFLSQVILIIGTIALARIYSPDDFGLMAWATTYSSIISVIAGMRYDHLALGKKNKELFFIISFSILTLLSALIAMILFLYVLYIEKNKEIYLLFFCIVINSTYYLSTQLLIAKKQYLNFGRLRVIQASSQIFLGLALAIIYPSTGLILSLSLSQLITSIIILTKERLIINSTIIEVFNIFKNHLLSAITNTFSILLQYSTPFAPIFIAPFFFESDVLGAYFLFSSAISSALSVSRRSLLTYFNGEITTKQKLQKVSVLLFEHAKKNTLKIYAFLSITLAILILIFFKSEFLVKLFFGNQWSEYSELIFPLVLYGLIDAFLQPFSTLLGIWGQENIQIKIESIRFMLVFFIWPTLIFIFNLNFILSIIIYLIFMSLVYIGNIFFIFNTHHKTNL